MEKKELTARDTKTEFIKSIHSWLMDTLIRNGKQEYQSCFTIEGSSIMCDLPTEYFNKYTIPADTRIEMKFISKKG